jgi:hypothetical protein
MKTAAGAHVSKRRAGRRTPGLAHPEDSFVSEQFVLAVERQRSTNDGVQRPPTVFVVADDVHVRRSLERLVTMTGMDVESYDSAEASRRCDAMPPCGRCETVMRRRHLESAK